MNRRCLLILALHWAVLAMPQPVFERLYDAGSSYKFNVTELPSHNLLVGLGYYRGVSILDPSANVIQTHYYDSDTVTGIGGIRPYSTNQFLFVAGYRKDSCFSGSSTIPDSYPLVGKIDSSGNILSMKHYDIGVGCSNVAGDITITNDGGAVTWGYRRDFFALKVDSSLQPIWAKAHARQGGFQFIKELPSGDLLAGINMDTAGAVVARLDPAGNFLWCKSYIRPGGMVHDAVIESDDSFVITGFTDSTALSPLVPYPASFQPKLFMMKLTGSGEVQWCRGYDSSPDLWYTSNPSNIVKTNDGKYAILATMGYPTSNFFFRPLLMKVDVNGDTLWTRSMGRSGFDHFTMDLFAYSDGGYLISGGVWGDLPGGNSGMPFIFKADSSGHLPCWERNHPIEVMELFPVDSSFTLTSVEGAVAMPAFLGDTTFAPITVYDGCTFTTGLPSKNHQAKRMVVRPNPNTGRFTLEFSEPLVAESWYSVYDATGKLLYQRPLPAGKGTEEADLSRYGRGTYVIKCTDRDGVYYERVVVE